MKFIARFVGDARGYTIQSSPPEYKDGPWIAAKVGKTEQTVLINLNQAYLIELTEE